ncbi:MAG: hypothetical protein KBD85_01975 [Elusimicrobia bacterium]|nr:hypothetical protein [Elusimicrobiota bacterium]
MAVRRRKKLKVTVRRSRVTYQWRAFAETVGRWVRVAAFVGSAAGLAWTAHWAWRQTDSIVIARVRVDGPVPDGWASSPPIKEGQPFFGFSAGAVQRRLMERFPELASVRVRRGADRSVTIRLEWRRPVARSSDGECWKGIDRSGAVFVLSGDGEGLPILALPDNARGAGEALAFLESLQQSKESWTQRLYKLKISADGEAVLMLAGETMVYWGDARTNLAEVGPKARRLQRVLDAPESAGGVESVRFVDDRRVVIKPRRAVVQRKETHG